MGLKQLLKEKAILASPEASQLMIPGEPMIYSVKYSLGNRSHSVQFFRNKRWNSILRTVYRSYYDTKTPVVLSLKFYVTPPEKARDKLTLKQIKSEKVPAVHCYELCEYLLSFQEMLLQVLINSYRQIVKVEAEKYYSDNPRTIMNFYSWDTYVKLQNKDTARSKGESINQDQRQETLQSKREGDATNENPSEKTNDEEPTRETIEGSIVSDRALPSPIAKNNKVKKTPTAAHFPSLQKAGHRQPDEVSE